MQKLEKAGEPTMEEILASIRQIISEEPATRQPPPPLVPRGAVAAQPFSMPTVPSMALPPVLAPAVTAAAAEPPRSPAPPQSAAATPVPPVAVSSAEPAPRSGQPGTDSVAMSDSLAGPPKSPSTGLSTASLSIGQNAADYGKSMWRFGKRAVEAPASQPEPNSADLTVAIELPGMTAPPVQAAPAPAPEPTIASPVIPASFVPPPPAPVAPSAPPVAAVTAPAPTITLPLPARVAPPSDLLASFVPGRQPSIIGLAPDPKQAVAAAVAPAPPMPISISSPDIERSPKPTAAAPPSIAVPAFVPAPALPTVPVPLPVSPPPFAAAPLGDGPAPLSIVLPVASPPSPQSPSPQSLDVNAAMSALAAGLAGGARSADTPPRSSPAVARAELPVIDKAADQASPPLAAARAPFVPAPPNVEPAIAAAPIAPAPPAPASIVPASTIVPLPQSPISQPPPALVAMMSPVKSLEDVVVDLLRPMLRQWLDDNMPRIIEKSLRVELAESLKKTALTK